MDDVGRPGEISTEVGIERGASRRGGMDTGSNLNGENSRVQMKVGFNSVC